jgi:hypothetical protein
MKTILPSLFLLLSFSAAGQANEITTIPRALFKVAPQNFIENTLKIGVEFFNKERTRSYNVYLYGRLESNNDSQPYYYGDKYYKGLGSELQYRKYISPLNSYTTRKGKNYLQGIYVSGYLQGASYSNEGDFVYYSFDQNTGQQIRSYVKVNESVGNVGTGFTIGVHRTLWSVLFIDVYIGGGVQWSDIVRTGTPATTLLNDYYGYYSITDPGYQGIMPKFGLQLGIAL